MMKNNERWLVKKLQALAIARLADGDSVHLVQR
jgi:hypothetical protein